MKRIVGGCGLALVLVLGVLVTPVAAATAKVTTGADSGPGSLRAALASGADQIVFDSSVTTITVVDPLEYNGTTPLRLIGSGQTLDGGGLTGPILTVTAGADLRVLRLTFTDRADSAIHLVVPVTRTGTVSALLDRSTVSDIETHAGSDPESHGVFIDDNAGSPASMLVELRSSTIKEAGIGTLSDQDGLRVNERGLGSITFIARASTISANGGDGVELDEAGDGDVALNIASSTFAENGPTDPGDLEDGIDVDEADAGFVTGTVTSSSFVGNKDEALDLNETGEGGIDMRFRGLAVIDTGDSGLTLEETDNGDVVTDLRSVVADDNGDNGVQVEEAGDGGVTADIASLHATGNASDGVNLEEVDAGDLTASIRGSSITGNTDDGVQADQGPTGTGTLRIRGSDISGNGDDQVNTDGVTLV